MIALTLELLDQAMVKCGNPLHVQVGTKDFMNEIVNLFKMKNLPKQVTIGEITCLDSGESVTINLKMGN